MHFRHFILMGVFLGAAVFLPNYAFAEKNDAAVQSDPHSAAVQPVQQNTAEQTLVSEKSNNPTASEKAVPVPSENAAKGQGGEVHLPAANPGNGQTVPVKPVPKSPNQTNNGIEKTEPSLKKASESAGTAAKVNDTGQTESPKTNSAKNKLPEVPESLPSKQTDSKAETRGQPPGLNAKSDTFMEDTDSSVSIKTSGSLTLAQKRHLDEENKTPSLTLAQKLHIDEENKTPSNNGKIPWDIEVMDNPPQRTQSSGGQSNDQFSPGGGTISFVANWFYRDEHFALNLGRIYTSRQAKFCHQWINAPPSPPPKAAPFFLTFTANLATGNDK